MLLNKKIKFHKGFSFIEVMLSVFLISVGITTTLSLITLGIRQSTENRRQLIAVMLSQEGIELVRNIRDTNAKAGESFSGMDEEDYIISYNDDPLVLTNSSSPESEKLKYNNGYYERGDGTDSQFSRRIQISGSDNTRTVYSTVVWGNGSIPNDPTERNCNLLARCAFTKITLNKWRDE